jgi:excisionase family DNA binding protein
MDKPIIPERLLKANDVARVLGVSRTQVYRLMSADLPAVRFGGTVRVRPEDLQKYIVDHLDTNGQNGDTHD